MLTHRTLKNLKITGLEPALGAWLSFRSLVLWEKLHAGYNCVTDCSAISYLFTQIKDPSLNLSRSSFGSYFNRCYDGGPLFYDHFLRFVSVLGCDCLLAGCILLVIDWFEQRGNVHVITDLRSKYSPIQQNMTTIHVNH